MGYGIMAWAMDIDRFASMFTPEERPFLEELSDICEQDFARMDSEYSSYIAKGCPTAREALLNLTKPDFIETSYGFMYAWAVEKIINKLGRFLDNSNLYPIRSSFMKEVDDALSEMGVSSISLSGLAFGKLPIKIPQPEDFPGVGHLTHAEVLRARDELNAHSYQGANDYVRNAIETLREWTEQAAADNRGIIAYYY